MSSNKNKYIKCHVCDNVMRSDTFKRHMQRADHQSDNTEGSGLWTQTVNNQMKRGYGLVETADEEDSESDSTMDVNDESDDESSESDVDTVEVDSKDSQPFTLNSLDQLVKSLKSEQLSYSRIYISNILYVMAIPNKKT